MSLILNPEQLRIRVTIGGECYLALIMRVPSNEEKVKFLSRRFKTGRGGKMKDVTAYEERIKFIDKILVDVEGYNADDEPETLEYLDPDGAKHTLNNKVDDWRKYIDVSVKIRAAIELESNEAEMEGQSAKN